MVDQNNPNNQKPEVPTGQTNSGATSLDSPPTPPPPPETPQVATIPTVVVSEPESRVPKWFYLIFAITLIVFFAVTTLIVLSFTQNKSTSPTTLPTAFPTQVQEVESPSLTPIPEDPIISKFNEQGSSDELTDIETDLNNTDLGELDKSLNELDSQMGVSP